MEWKFCGHSEVEAGNLGKAAETSTRDVGTLRGFENFVFFSYFLWKGGIEGTGLVYLLSTFDKNIKPGVGEDETRQYPPVFSHHPL